MTGLIDLSTELLLDMVSMIRSKRSLWALAQTSKPPSAIAINLLYEIYENLYMHMSFTPFLDTIMARPDLGSKVKKLALRPPTPS